MIGQWRGRGLPNEYSPGIPVVQTDTSHCNDISSISIRYEATEVEGCHFGGSASYLSLSLTAVLSGVIMHLIF